MSRKVLSKLFLVCCWMFLCTLFSSGSLAAPENVGFDAVILLDASGSMKTKSDPDRIAIEASKLFIDMCEVNDSSISLVAFSADIKNVVDFMPTDSAANNAEFKKILDAIPYKGYTDIGLGMKEARRLVERRTNEFPGRKTVVLFLSDGVTDISDSSERTKDLSAADCKEATDYFSDHNVPVYTIGLNNNNQANRDDLELISASTGGVTYLTDSAKDLPGILNQIFAKSTENYVVLLDSFIGTGDYEEIKINIPNSSILESNVIILSEHKIPNVQLLSPAGREVDLSESGYVFSRSEVYSLLKIIRPEKGLWLLRVKGAKGDDITVTLINNYNLNIAVNFKPELGELALNKALVVEAKLYTNSDFEIDEYAYSGMDGKVYVQNAAGTTAEYKMAYVPSGNLMSCEIPIREPGEFKIWCEMISADILKKSTVSAFSIENHPPVQTVQDLSYRFDIKNNSGNAAIENILQYFADEDGDVLSVELLSFDESKLSAEVKVDKLVLGLKEAGSSDIMIEIRDPHGGSAQAQISITAEDFLTAFLTAGALVAALAAVTAVTVILVRIKRKGYFTGDIFVCISPAVGETIPCPAPFTCDLCEWGRRTITLHDAALRSGLNVDEQIVPFLFRIVLSPEDKGRSCMIAANSFKRKSSGNEVSVSSTKLEIKLTYTPYERDRDIF